MKRPILIITLGFITGILGGLYINIVPFVFLCLICFVLILKNINIKKGNVYIKILDIYIRNNIILVFIISSFISSTYLMYCNKRYEELYNSFVDKEMVATVMSNTKETEYKYTYKIKLEGYNDIKLILRISKNKNITLNYGDRVKVKGEYSVPDISRNYGGFNYRRYLKTQKIYGIYETEKIEVLSRNNLNKIEIFTNNFKKKIIDNINKVLPGDTKDLFLGILIGYDENLSEDLKESFEKSSLTHLLAVSGAHIAYIIVGMNFLLKRLKIPKKITIIITILVLIFFMYITDFSASVVRASIMGIILLLGFIFFKKNDIFNSISLSILLILLENPYKILDIGLILSYFATIGIICFSNIENKNLQDNSNIYTRLINYLKELVFITIFANIFVAPIMAYNFNTISLTFVISNLIAGILIGPITILGFVLIILLFINIKLAYIVSIPYNLLLELLIRSTNITSLIPLSEILVSTPSIVIIIIYYLFILICLLLIVLRRKYSNRFLVKKILIYFKKFFYFIKRNYKTVIIVIIFLSVVVTLISKINSRDLKIYFIDVGQGDSTLVITPTNKKILIDSGGAEDGNFDGGESTLLPYLLDRRINSLDYICISHFDSDHCKNFIYLLNNIKVKNIILSKQYEATKNFEEIIKIIKRKKINLLKVEEGNILNIDKYVRLKIFSPGKELTDDINDNSIVMKLEYLNFSSIFTGDISKQIEKNLVEKYHNQLNSTILKVAHHGSNSSSDKEFVKIVSPKISLIGVGKNNKFGHPNQEVIKILEEINSKIYRTDLCGEIVVEVDKKRKNKNQYSYKVICIKETFLVNNTKKEFMQGNDNFEKNIYYIRNHINYCYRNVYRV